MTAESLRDRLDTVEQRYSSLIEQKDLLDVEAVSASLLGELYEISREVYELEERRQLLLKKDRLSTKEGEELVLLNEIANDLKDLRDLVDSSLASLDPGKEAVLKTKNPTHTVDKGRKYGVSASEILLNFVKTPNLRPVQIAKLQSLKFTEKEIDDLSVQRNMAYFLLKYCNLPKSQRDKVLTMVETIDLEDPTGGFGRKHGLIFDFALLLGSIQWPEKTQNLLIEKLEKFVSFYQKGFEAYEKSDDAGEEYEGDFNPEYHPEILALILQADLLGSKYLNNIQKTRIAGSIVIIGSPLDCAGILKKYPQYLTPEAKKLADDKVRYVKHSEFRDIYALTPEVLGNKKVRFVVHPLYDVFGDMDENLWMKARGNPKKYLESWMTKKMNEMITEKSEEKRYAAYMNLLRIFNEYDEYQNLAKRKDVVTMYVLPHGVDLNIGYDFFKLFSQFQGDNVFFMESASDTSGNLKVADLSFLNKTIPKGKQIEVSGGYLNLCLESSVGGLLNLGKRVIRQKYSVSATAPDASAYIARNRAELPKLVLPIGAVSGFEDIVKIMQKNVRFNQKYEEVIRNMHANAAGKDQDDPDFYVQHK